MSLSSNIPGACCASMSRQLDWKCKDHPSVEDCPDALVGRFGRQGAYGLFIHDGGNSYVEIVYCPWCGTRLRDEQGSQKAQQVHEISGGDVVLWSVDGVVHIKTTDEHYDPVELNEHSAMELSDLLRRLVNDG